MSEKAKTREFNVTVNIMGTLEQYMDGIPGNQIGPQKKGYTGLYEAIRLKGQFNPTHSAGFLAHPGKIFGSSPPLLTFLFCFR